MKINPIEAINTKRKQAIGKIKILNAQIKDAEDQLATIKTKEQKALDEGNANALKDFTSKRVELESNIDSWSRVRDHIGVGYTNADVECAWTLYAEEINKELIADITEFDKKYEELYKLFIKLIKKQNEAIGNKYKMASFLIGYDRLYDQLPLLGMHLKQMNHPEVATAFNEKVKADYGYQITADTFINAMRDEAFLEEL